MAGGGVSGGGVSDPDAANKWSCVTMQHGGPPSCGPSGSATSDALRATASAEHLSIASVPPSPAAPRTANDPESSGAALDALKQAQPAATRRSLPRPAAARTPRCPPPGAIVATLTELIEPFGLNDNVTIPVFSSIALQFGFSRISSCHVGQGQGVALLREIFSNFDWLY